MMTPDQAKAIAQTVGQHLQQEWMKSYKVMKAVPEAKKDYRPESHARSAFELTAHMAAADFLFLDAIVAGSFSGEFKDTADGDTIEQLAESYKHQFPRRLEQVLALDPAKLARELDFFGMKAPAVTYMIWTLTHMVHHRGQLTTYLRPMGSKVPSIYGGSYDEPWQG
jgi:uncharacterized damage-inducible protein DinB